MNRAFTLIVENFVSLWLGKNSSLTEIPMVKARPVKLLRGRP